MELVAVSEEDDDRIVGIKTLDWNCMTKFSNKAPKFLQPCLSLNWKNHINIYRVLVELRFNHALLSNWLWRYEMERESW